MATRFQQAIYDPVAERGADGPGYEESLYQQMLEPRNYNLHILFGGLGAGKTTSILHLVGQMKSARQSIQLAFPCQCQGGCRRAPLVVDFGKFGPQWARETKHVIPDLLREVRLSLFERLIEEWLDRSGVQADQIKAVDKNYRTIRRLLIVNDLARFDGADHSHWDELRYEPLDIGRSLLDTIPTTESLTDLVTQHRANAEAYEAKLLAVTNHSSNALRMVALTIEFYGSTCSPSNPMNLIILDNLDQLPTAEIERFVAAFHDIASHAPQLPVLVPLRPSSVRVAGNVRDIRPRLHYSPNNFAVVLARLKRFVLDVSRDQLALPRNVRKDSPFLSTPSDAELNAFILATYIYANIMAAGIDYREKVQTTRVEPHPTHKRYLSRFQIPFTVSKTLAATIDALVGLSCRYALSLAGRFIENAYSSQAFIDICRELERVAEPPVRLSYADLVSFILRTPKHEASHTENLFEVPHDIPFRNAGWPTLAKLRIVEALVDEDYLPVPRLIQRLGAFGVPAAVTVSALNSLQDKYRLLLWLTTNEPLVDDREKLLHEDAMLSEHGQAYFARVAGDFEYVWHCARAFEAKRLSDSNVTFATKLNGYVRTIQRVGETEWKQIAFERMRKDAPSAVYGRSTTHQMIVLDVLYCSMSAAFRAIRIAAEHKADVRGMIANLSDTVTSICEAILTWQSRYEVAYGGNFYLDVYRSEIDDMKHELSIELMDPTLTMNALIAVRAVSDSWSRGVAVEPTPVGISDFPVVRYRQLLEARGAMSTGQAGGTEGDVALAFIERYRRVKAEIKAILSSHLPSHCDVVLMLSSLRKVIVNLTLGPRPPARELLQWCVAEQARLDQLADVFEQSAYVIPHYCSREAMSDLKKRHNALVRALLDFATLLEIDAVSHGHLDCRWWE